MSDMHLASVDLNLLVALDALLSEQSVTRAAVRVGITQSAMSHTLARLRELFGDELLVRSASGMVPTLRAEVLGEAVGRALTEVRRALAPPDAFDPKTARARIVIGTSDYAELVLLPELFNHASKEAPGIDLRVHVIESSFTRALAAGTFDLIIAPVRDEDEGPGILTRKLFDERFVCVVRRGHPLAGKRLTLARFAAASHALISPRGQEGGFVDDALERLGHRRRVAVAVPHFLIAPHLVARSDAILTVAERVATVLAEPLGLVLLPPPKELGLKGFTMSALWHERTHKDPVRAWLRAAIGDIAKTV